MAHVAATENGDNGSPYVELDRSAWAALADAMPLPLSADEVERLRGLGEELDLNEVSDVYLPISRLLSLYVRHVGALYRETEIFLGARQPERTPFVIGIAGSVAVGKSTTARLLRELLAHWPEHPNVALVTTDGFLYPNDELERRGLLNRKGFPESYDRKALLRFVIDIKSGRDEVEAPVYSHLEYDVLPDRRLTLSKPDIILIEGLNVLQPARVSAEGGIGSRGTRLLRLLGVRRRGDAGHQALVHGAVPSAARDGVPRPGVVLPPLRPPVARTRRSPRRRHLGRDQRTEPRQQHRADP